MTDRWDRRLNTAYVQDLLKESLVEGGSILPDIVLPSGKGGLDAYESVIVNELPVNSQNETAPDGQVSQTAETRAAEIVGEKKGLDRRRNRSSSLKKHQRTRKSFEREWENPEMFGLHPNADMISFKNEQNNIFRNASILLGRSLIDQETSKRASGSKSENNSQNETDTSQDDEDSEDSEDDREENDDVNDGSKDNQTRNLTSGHLLSPGMDFLSHGDLELLKATVARMGARLPKLLDVPTDDATTQSLLTQPDQAPYVSFILQESFRMNLLIREMRCTLGQLRLALMGQCSMSNKLGAVAADILINEIPASFRVRSVLTLAFKFMNPSDIIGEYIFLFTVLICSSIIFLWFRNGHQQKLLAIGMMNFWPVIGS